MQNRTMMSKLAKMTRFNLDETSCWRYQTIWKENAVKTCTVICVGWSTDQHNSRQAQEYDTDGEENVESYWRSSVGEETFDQRNKH